MCGHPHGWGTCGAGTLIVAAPFYHPVERSRCRGPMKSLTWLLLTWWDENGTVGSSSRRSDFRNSVPKHPPFPCISPCVRPLLKKVTMSREKSRIEKREQHNRHHSTRNTRRSTHTHHTRQTHRSTTLNTHQTHHIHDTHNIHNTHNTHTAHTSHSM